MHYNYNNFQTIVFPKNNCGGIFSSKTRDMSLVVFWLFLLSHIEEKFLPPLPYKREPKREEYHQLLKKPKGYKGHVPWPGAKNAPTIKGR